MRHVKAVAVGLGVGLTAAVLWVVGNLWLPLYFSMLTCRLDPNCGGGIGASGVGEGSTLLVMLLTFVGAYNWMLRRERRRQRQIAQ